MGEKIKIGQIVYIKRKSDEGVETKEMYQVEAFCKHFIGCRHIKGEYRENFIPHDLYRSGVIDWNQVLAYMGGQITAVCEV